LRPSAEPHSTAAGEKIREMPAIEAAGEAMFVTVHSASVSAPISAPLVGASSSDDDRGVLALIF